MVAQHDVNSLRLFDVEDEFPPISLWTTLGGYVLIATVGGAIALSTLVSIPISVRVRVTVRPADEQGLVQAAIEGKIKTINVTEGQNVRLGDVIAQLDDSELQAQKRNLQDRIYQNKVRNQAGIQEAQAILDQAQDKFNRFLMLAREGALPQMQLEQARQEVEGAKARLNRISHDLQTSQDQAELNQIESSISKTVIRATTSGTILRLNVHQNSSQIVRSGDPIVQIVSSDNISLVVKGCIPQAERSKVKRGSRVQMKFDAYPYPDHGTLIGTVNVVGGDRVISQENSSTANTSCYPIAIAPDQTYLVQRIQPIQLGMEADADIISGEEKIANWILRQTKLISGL